MKSLPNCCLIILADNPQHSPSWLRPGACGDHQGHRGCGYSGAFNLFLTFSYVATPLGMFTQALLPGAGLAAVSGCRGRDFEALVTILSITSSHFL